MYKGSFFVVVEKKLFVVAIVHMLHSARRHLLLKFQLATDRYKLNTFRIT